MATILIVDDQKSVLLTLEALLVKAGYSVVPVSTAFNAMRVLAQGGIDLVITDAIMPEADGYSLVRSIRKQPALNKMPVILLTGKREKTDIEKGIESGVNDYVVKPIDPEFLIAKIRNLLVARSDEAVTFAETPVSFKVDFEMRTEIISVSELGLQITSNLPLPLGKILKIQSAFFDEVGIPKVPLRIDSCDEMGQPDMFRIKAHFVGITEKELTPLRLWIRTKKIAR
ncbi:MAG: response regulator [Pseudobdellovibrionaceae bacterium]